MCIDNPDSPNLMPDSFANAGPELRAYMTGRSPFDVREPSYSNTRNELRSTIDSQESFSKIARGADNLIDPLPDEILKPKKSFLKKEEEDMLSKYKIEPEPILLTEPKEDLIERYKIPQEETTPILPETLLNPKPKEDIIERYKIPQEETTPILPETLLRPPKKTFKNYSIISEEPTADPLAEFRERKRRQAKAIDNLLVPREPEIPTIPEIPKIETKPYYYTELFEQQSIPIAPIEPEPTKSASDIYKQAAELLKNEFPAPITNPETRHRPKPKPPKSMIDIAREAANILLNKRPKPAPVKPKKEQGNWTTFMKKMNQVKKRKEARNANNWDDFMEQFK